ncbi:hypothetical protein PF005_g24430 [Phytophthora fragariae]|uniref:Peptidase A2 domain-containing protein n=2 Tax=Phytophthora fragariae TaxID=53985 RepID=A0A6A3RI49_9STRA|nr:hypothetical protein PF003_g39144 [Phytophthora fragariae]KAE8938916.1 hypothetical protein PF009_g11224 [Phytophthora fragariae]KAE8978675.1 hypothetical protein PF011_g23145 [Phytophthora fragariae]KAE9076007.1 hypothetical protein PF007_g24789 [Phytophthora fragariae]KAE9097105.1 hypothetical protein PF006_g23648 [Phytophthora fragariae]
MEAARGNFQAQLESEKNRQAREVAEEKARLESEGRRQALELEVTRKELLALREARERDQEAAINVQKYYARQLREKRAATTQSNPRDEVPVTPQVPAQAAQTTADGHFAAQLQATLRKLQQAKVKNDAASRSRNATQAKTEQSSEKRGPPGRTPPGGSDPPKKDPGRSRSSRRDSARKISKRGNDPHDSDPDSDSDKKDDESSDDSDSSFFEESVPNAMTSKTSQAGTTVFTYKSYVNASALEDFNEKASLSTRIRWLEKFQSMAVQGGWSDKMRIYEMKLKLPSSARDWRYNLEEDVRHSWKRFLKAFKEKYCKAKTSDSERYYSMTQKKTEAPLEFFYRLNRVADKAGINFRKSSKERERHFKVFMKKLLDSSLRSTLQGQRLHSLEDLEFVLKQYEEMHQDDDYETPPPRRESRPDYMSAGKFRPKRPAKTNVAQSKVESSSEDEKQVHFQETVKRSQIKKWRQGRRRVNFRKIGRKCIERWRTPVGNLLRESFDLMTRRPDLASHQIRPDSARRESVLDTPKIVAGPDSNVIDVKPVSPLDGDPERAGPKKPPELCALVYLGPELKSRTQGKHECMTVFKDDDSRSDDSSLDVPELDPPIEFRLKPGERFGWWKDHESDDDRKVATVHGTVNNHRIPIMLDTGASVSMVSADLARKLKLKLSVHSPLRVSGLGGVPTIIRSKAQVKVTIGPRVVYILDLWVVNIGEWIDTLLGMDFMYSAGVRICVREGLVKLPDEEAILLNRGGAIRKAQGLDLAVTPDYTARLLPGRSVVVQIHYAQMDPHRDEVWAGRGDRWVTKLIFASKSYPVAVKVVNISDKNLNLSFQTPIARIVERDSFPMAGRFVRPGSRKYLEWQHLIYETTFSDQMERRIDEVTQMYEDQGPPCVEKEEYGWPNRVLRRLPLESAAVRIVQKAEQDCPPSETSKREEPSSEPEVRSERESDAQTVGLERDDEDESDFVDALEEIMPPSEDDDGDEYFDAISLDDDYVCDPPNEILEEEEDDVPVQDWLCTPLRKLELEYERYMKMNVEDLDPERNIYIHGLSCCPSSGISWCSSQS